MRGILKSKVFWCVFIAGGIVSAYVNRDDFEQSARSDAFDASHDARSAAR